MKIGWRTGRLTQDAGMGEILKERCAVDKMMELQTPETFESCHGWQRLNKWQHVRANVGYNCLRWWHCGEQMSFRHQNGDIWSLVWLQPHRVGSTDTGRACKTGFEIHQGIKERQINQCLEKILFSSECQNTENQCFQFPRN